MRLKTVAFLPAHLVEAHGLYLRKPQQFLSRHLSEQFELNMQLLGMEAYPRTREFAYIEDSLHQPLPSLYWSANGYQENLRLSVNAFG